MSTMTRRFAAIEATIGRVAAIQRSQGVTPEALGAIKQELSALAAQTELFPPDAFHAGETGGFYRLAEDTDHHFALYAIVGQGGYRSPVHNHTTWAAIAGVRGEEHNRFYERTDNRDVPGIGRLRQTGEFTVIPGTSVAYMPDDFHAIEMIGDGPWLQLHLYGRSLEHLPERIRFETPEGGAYSVYPANPRIGQLELPPAAVKAAISDGEELALLDVREEAAFSLGHLLFASNLPLSRLEVDAPLLVPRREARVIVIDGAGEGLAQRAARRLFDLGWKNIAVLQGGVEGWGAAGYVVFSGFNVPSKAFGEVVEHTYGTPHIEAAALKQRLDAGEEILILDSRPFDEFQVMSIPGGLDAPGVELVGRAHALLKSPTTPVVVNCAGRTRSIIGAQLLINAGLSNPVAALKDGTMGWHLAGLTLARGSTDQAPRPDAAALAEARHAAGALAARFGVQVIDHAALAGFKGEATERSLFRFDVRTPEEYAAGHLPGFVSAPGGQLVQATDCYVGTLRGRIVLADDDGVRARLTASWLVQAGWDDVFVLEDAQAGQTLETGAEPLSLCVPEGPSVSPAALEALLAQGGVTVFDISLSRDYRRGHVPGAIWLSRPRLADALGAVPEGRAVVLVSPDGVLARFAAGELPARPGLAVLEGGAWAWRAAGLAEETETRFAHEPGDAWLRPDDGTNTPEGKMRGYLAWEVALPAQIAQDGDARFRVG